MTTVSYGSTGSAVKTLQAALTALGHRLDIDGEFGYDSHFKVKLFQTEQGLVSDGIVGPLTWSKIYGLLTVKVWALSKTPLWVGSVTASSLNVRSYASSLFGQVQAWPVLGQGNQIDVCDELTGPQGDSWLYVRIAGGVFGFVSEKYVKKV
jgi:peptidoglycan hydrolase-like protein with peptidoglycan-binding domain